MSCVVGKRTAAFCRLVRGHVEEAATACSKCAQKEIPVTKCRVEYKHHSTNGMKTVPVTSVTEDGYSECCQELSNFHMQVLTEATKTPQRCYATGYLLPYTAETWTQWRNKFQAQTGTTYVSQCGKQKNAGKGNGVVEVGGKMEEFRVSWSHTYRCFRGGKPRLKPEVKNPLKRRNAPGSRRCGCPAEIRTRLMVTKSGLSLLEVTIPPILLHKGHDPRSVTDKLCHRMLPEVEEKVRLLVTEAHLHNLHLKLVLDDWVKNHLIPKHKQEGVIQETPSQYDRAYFPTTKDLRNVAQQAVMQSRSSCFDQVCIRIYKIKFWS